MSITEEAKQAANLFALRQRRNTKLLECDYTQLPDYTKSDKLDWAVYRQELKDITNHYSSLEDVVWPSPPEAE